MSSFSADTFAKKLGELNNTAPSIQTLALWLIHHRKHAKDIVKTWKKEIINANPKKKLTIMYLANDVIQNSKKKGPEFNQAFGNELGAVFKHLGSITLDEKTEKGLARLLQVWRERLVFSDIQIARFKTAFESGAASPADSVTMSPDGLFKEPPPPKKLRNSNGAAPEKRHRKRPAIKEVEVEGHKEVHVMLSPGSPARDPPEPAELIKAIQDLESSASSDVDAREKISSLPPEVSDVALLSRLQDQTSGQRLMTQVNEALSMLTEYNSRLAAEMDERKRVARMLQDFTQAQKDLLAQAERSLEEYRKKLEKVYLVREELKSHIQNLPDISSLPDVASSRIPLPSAGDLFT